MVHLGDIRDPGGMVARLEGEEWIYAPSAEMEREGLSPSTESYLSRFTSELGKAAIRPGRYGDCVVYVERPRYIERLTDVLLVDHRRILWLTQLSRPVRW
jgi:hypothetical protein